MRYAQLWKRVLNQGLDKRSFRKGVSLSDLEEAVVRAPQITSSVEFSPRVGWSGYLNLCIPFDQFWMEGVSPTGSLWGVLFTVVKSDDESRYIKTHHFAGWTGRQPIFIGSLYFRIRNDGKLQVEEDGNIDLGYAITPLMQSSRPADEPPDGILTCVLIAVLENLSLLGCKNVGLLAKNDLEKKQAKRAAKRFGGNPDYYKYHVLVVRPPGAKAGDKSKEQEIGIMPRHVCRGHFAEYGPEFGKGLLFGQYAGRFFIPPHLKGKKENGTVEKDYQIPVQPLA